MTPDEIRAHPYYGKLTDRQKVFVDALLANGNDKVAAAKKAWDSKTDDSARTMANRALKQEGIAYLVDQYFGTDPDREMFTRDSALAFASSKARKTIDDKLALDYLKLVVEMNGWRVKPADNDKPKEDAFDPNATFD